MGLPRTINVELRLPQSVLRVLHYGSRYQCPFCESDLRRLRPFGFEFEVLKEKAVIGAGVREHCVCPVCQSMDRERLLLLYLRHKTTLFSQATRLLHVAPEGRLKTLIEQQSGVDYVTADLNRKDVTTRMDICAIPYPADSFDAVICNHVLEHVPDDHRAMTELLRILKPGGWGILQVPISYVLESTYENPSITSERDREQHFGQFDHVRIYAADYIGRLREAGFVVDVFDWRKHGEAFGAPSNLYALIPEERVFAVSKPR